MVTMKDIATQAGVSVMTVSNALRGRDVVAPDTARRILELADSLGYQVNAATLSARSLRSGLAQGDGYGKGTIGVAIFDFDNIQPAILATEISRVAAERGCQTIFQQTRSEASGERAIIQGIASQFCDGLIFSSQMIDPEEIVRITRHRPTVLIDDDRPQQRLDTVLSPCEEGARAAIEYLWNTGRRHIGIVGNGVDVLSDPMLDSGVGARRVRGCLDAFDGLGLRVDPAWFVASPWHEVDARDVVRADAERFAGFDALFCMTDSIAIGVMRGLHDIGMRVPDDVAVMGFDGIVIGEVAVPSLTTVAVDIPQTASLAVDCVMGRMDGTAAGQRRRCVADFTIVRRESA